MYFKVCLGAAVGWSAGVGWVSNSGGKSCSNPPKRMLGVEFGVTKGPVSGDVGISFDTGGKGASVSGGIGSGGKLGSKAKVTACYYQRFASYPGTDCCE